MDLTCHCSNKTTIYEGITGKSEIQKLMVKSATTNNGLNIQVLLH